MITKSKDIISKICQEPVNNRSTKLVDYRTVINYISRPFQEAIRIKYIKENSFNHVNTCKNTQKVKYIKKQRFAKKN